MFGPRREPPAPRPLPLTGAQLATSRRQLVDELDRADRAIRAAMGHADQQMFGRFPYRGPERRTKPR